MTQFGDGVIVSEYAVPGDTHKLAENAIADSRTWIPELKGWESYTDCFFVLFEYDDNTVKAAYRAVVRLPGLRPGAPAEVAECFRSSREALESHEALHVEIGRGLFPELVAAVRAASSDEARQEIARAFTERAEALNHELDLRTDHGGPACRFPPPSCTHRTAS